MVEGLAPDVVCVVALEDGEVPAPGEEDGRHEDGHDELPRTWLASPCGRRNDAMKYSRPARPTRASSRGGHHASPAARYRFRALPLRREVDQMSKPGEAVAREGDSSIDMDGLDAR